MIPVLIVSQSIKLLTLTHLSDMLSPYCQEISASEFVTSLLSKGRCQLFKLETAKKWRSERNEIAGLA